MAVHGILMQHDTCNFWEFCFSFMTMKTGKLTSGHELRFFEDSMGRQSGIWIGWMGAMDDELLLLETRGTLRWQGLL
jgi:hypothetical protein